MRNPTKRSVIGEAAIALSVIALSACASLADPVPDADTMHFYTAWNPVYLSVDGRTTLLFNDLMKIMAISTAPEAGGPATKGPTTDVDESCGKPGMPCVTLLGVTLSVPAQIETKVAENWKLGGAAFRIVGCVYEAAGHCVTHLISSTGRDGSGWYVYSRERGVELFVQKAASGYGSVYLLTADTGLLRVYK